LQPPQAATVFSGMLRSPRGDHAEPDVYRHRVTTYWTSRTTRGNWTTCRHSIRIVWRKADPVQRAEVGVEYE
jgi:hypothetical protein